MRDIDAEVRRLRRQGYTVAKGRRSGHWKVRDSAGHLIGVLSATSGDWRSLRNIRSDIRKTGKRDRTHVKKHAVKHGA